MAIGLACSAGKPAPPDAATAPTPPPVDAAAAPADGAPRDAPIAGDARDVAEARAADAAGPLADPIPAQPLAPVVTVRLEEVLTMPASRPWPEPGDSRLRRWCRINYLGELPDGSARLFVPDLNGRLYFIEGRTPTVYLDLAAEFAPDFWSHRGLGAGFGFVAFHPDFASNGTFFTVHTEAGNALASQDPSLPAQVDPVHHGVLTRWIADDPRAHTFAGTRREVMRIAFASYIHGIQEINFAPTAGPSDQERGWLYIAVGDGGVGLATGDPQDLGKPHGKILRIDPEGTDGPRGAYSIPPGNPFAGRPGALPEIYAYGLRDPHRFTWDGDGRMFLASIGEHNIESVYEVRPGDNLGWPAREGPFLVQRGDPTCGVYPLPADDARHGFTYPVLAYDHDPGRGFSACADSGDAIAGGFVYRGTRLPGLRGHYVFGDIVDGRLFHAPLGDMRRGGPLAPLHRLGLVDERNQPVTMQSLAGQARVDLRFGRDGRGELYVLSKANGKIWRMTAAAPPSPALRTRRRSP
jgi:glucose/arabinose dehydrogenase